MSRISQAFLHVPLFRELVPISRDPSGKWTIDDVPSATYQALGHERFTAWKNEVMNFVDAGRVSGMPEGLMFELLAAPNPDADWLTLQAFGGEVIRILADGESDTPAMVSRIRGSAVSLNLAHIGPQNEIIPGRPKTDG